MATFIKNGIQYVYEYDKTYDKKENATYYLIIPVYNCEDYNVIEYEDKIVDFFKSCIPDLNVVSLSDDTKTLDSPFFGKIVENKKTIKLNKKRKMYYDAKKVNDIFSILAEQLREPTLLGKKKNVMARVSNKEFCPLEGGFQMDLISQQCYILCRLIDYPEDIKKQGISSKILHSIVSFDLYDRYYLNVGIKQKSIHVVNICVNKRNKLSGAGVLLNLLIDLCVKIEYDNVVLHSMSNENTYSFYIKNGFVPISKKEEQYYSTSLIKKIDIRNRTNWKLDKVIENVENTEIIKPTNSIEKMKEMVKQYNVKHNETLTMFKSIKKDGIVKYIKTYGLEKYLSVRDYMLTYNKYVVNVERDKLFIKEMVKVKQQTKKIEKDHDNQIKKMVKEFNKKNTVKRVKNTRKTKKNMASLETSNPV